MCKTYWYAKLLRIVAVMVLAAGLVFTAAVPQAAAVNVFAEDTQQGEAQTDDADKSDVAGEPDDDQTPEQGEPEGTQPEALGEMTDPEEVTAVHGTVRAAAKNHTVKGDGDTSDDYSLKIKDEKLRKVVRILVNYSYDHNGHDPYASNGIPGIVPDTTDITADADLVSQYDKPVSQVAIESYPHMIDLAPYSGIETLEGISTVKRSIEIVLPKDAEAISAKTFYEMRQLSKVRMPDTVTSIGDSAFEKCESLYSLLVYDHETMETVAPAGTYSDINYVINLRFVKTIGPSAFSQCVSIHFADLYSGEGPVSIGSNAFASCTGLYQADIPAGTLGTGVFQSCTSLWKVKFADSYKKIPDNTLQNIGHADGARAQIDLPSDLEEIGAYAFANDVIDTIDLTSCTHLKKIGEYAFRNTKCYESSENFSELSGCTGLTTICHEAFAGMTFVYSQHVILPDSVKDIGSCVFFSADGIYWITLPAAITEIPEGMFMLCRYLKRVDVPEGSKIESIGAHAFDLCEGLSNTDFLSQMKKLNTIGDYAFARCMPETGVLAALQSITIPDSVTSIGASAFENDYYVTKVTIGSGVTTIPDRFLICEKSTSPTWSDVEIEDPLTHKKYIYPFKTGTSEGYKNVRNAFKADKNICDLSSLDNITMPDGVTEIGKEAFYGNTHLSWINDSEDKSTVKLPESLTTIGESAFASCSFHTGSDKNESEDDKLVITGIRKVIIPDAISSIGESAFAGDFSLDWVKFPESLKAIPAHCFDGCCYDDSYTDEATGGHHYHGLQVISDISGIESIGDYAFNKCRLLSQKFNKNTSYGECSDIEFGSKLEYLGKYAFAESGIVGASTLSDTVIKQINESTFYRCSELQIVNCPDTLEGIGNSAFRECPKLTVISFPVGASLASSMIAKNEQMITLTPTLGRYRKARFKVPVGESVNLPANAFANGNLIISQVDPDDPEKSTEIGESEDPDNYFNVKRSKDSFIVKGGSNEVLGTALRIVGTVEFDNYGANTMSIDYPVDVTVTHADQDSIAFDGSKFRIGTKAAGKLFDGEGSEPQVLYVSKSEAGNTLTLAADALSRLEEGDVDENRGLITDPADWVVAGGDALTYIEGSTEKTTSADKCTTTAQFKIKGEGEATVKVLFGKGTEFEASGTVRVVVVDAVSSISYNIKSLGDKPNPKSITIPLRDDEITLSDAHMDNDKPWDSVIFSSSNINVAKVEEKAGLTGLLNSLLGRKTYVLKGLCAGTATITMKTACGNASTSFKVNIKDEGETVPPTYVGILPAEGETLPTEIYVGEPVSFTSECLPEDSAQAVTWQISDGSIAELETNGGQATLTGKTANKSVKLTVKAADGTAQSSIDLAVRQKASSLSMIETDPIIAKDSVKSLLLTGTEGRNGTVVRLPETSDEEITFTSSNTDVLALGTSTSNCNNKIVALRKNGSSLYYKGVADGTAKITAVSENGKTAEITIKVTSNPIKDIDYTIESLGDAHQNPTKLYMPSGQADSIKAVPIYTGDGEKLDHVTYSSDNSDVVRVSDDGAFEACGIGTARITISSATGKVTRVINVTVREDQASTEPLYIRITDQEGGEAAGRIYVGDSAAYAAECIPAYASQGVEWALSDDTLADLVVSGGIATVTGSTPNKTVKLTASSSVINSVTSTWSIALKQKSALDFRETPPTVAVNQPKSFTLSSTATQTDGIIRTNPDSDEPVTFKSSNTDILQLGSSDSPDSFSDEPLRIERKTGTVYYKGLIEGEATITARTDNGETATLLVTIVKDPITSIDCNNKTINLMEGKTAEMQIEITPADSKEKISFTSSDPDVATIDDEGKITAIAPGKATVRAQSVIKKKSASATVTVYERAEAIQFADKELIIAKGTNASMTVSSMDDPSSGNGFIRMPSTTWERVTFTSSDAGVFAVGEKSGTYSAETAPIGGKQETQYLYYSAVGNGEATLNARSESGKTASLTVKVTDNPIKILNYTVASIGDDRTMTGNMSLTMPLAQEDVITAAPVYTSDDGDKIDEARFSSSDSSVVTIDETGKFKAVRTGTATVTISSAAGKATARTIKVTVSDTGEVITPLYMTVTGKGGSELPKVLYAGESVELDANCLPGYADQAVTWTCRDNPEDDPYVMLDPADGRASDGNIKITGVKANERFTITAKPDNGRVSAVSVTFAVRQKADGLVFIEQEPVTGINTVNKFRLYSNDDPESVSAGIVRSPASSLEEVEFTSSDPSVLLLGTSSSASSVKETSVTVSGQSPYVYYKGIAPGTATISARSVRGNKTDELRVTVVEPATALSCSNNKITLLNGGSEKMQITKTPEDSTDPVLFKSSNSSVATVGPDGTITAAGSGTAKITARSKVGNASAVCDVTVRQQAESIEFREAAPTILVGASAARLALSSDPNQTGGIIRTPETSDEPVTFTSSDTSILIVGKDSGCSSEPATISTKTGTLYYKGLKQGKATITASTKDHSDTLQVTVIEPITEITCADSTLSMTAGTQVQMQISKTPDYSWEPVDYKTSNEKVASVNESGVITAIGTGTATITVRGALKRASATCRVTVKAAAPSKPAGASTADGDGILDPKLPAVKFKKPRAAKKSMTAKWKKLSSSQKKAVKGIEIEYSIKKDFSKPKFKKAGKKKTSIRIKKLISKKKYYVRARTYVNRGGVKYVSKWSSIKTVKVK